jgi:hypothetical protein
LLMYFFLKNFSAGMTRLRKGYWSIDKAHSVLPFPFWNILICSLKVSKNKYLLIKIFVVISKKFLLFQINKCYTSILIIKGC